MPPGPVHDRVNVELAVKGPTLALPDNGLVPAQPLSPPLAVQAVAPLVVQFKVEVPPEATVAGDAVRFTVGAGVDP